MKKIPEFAILACALVACSSTSVRSPAPVRVEIVKTDSGYQLLRGGKPYTIKGAGMSRNDIERFSAHGGNSIRNWTTFGDYQDARELLDAAHAHNVSVALCLPMKAERHGFDYNDPEAVAAQLNSFRDEVIRYRDHPALLTWIIGNELNHSYTNSKVYDAVNDVAKMIHELDPNHPTTTTVSGYSDKVIVDIQTRAPEIDFISFQLYGSLFSLADKIAQTDFDEPFMVTEWGALGHWEMEKTSWGAPTETTSTERVDVILRGHRDILSTLKGQLIGSYVFLWGQKQERTPTWYGMFTEAGEETEVVDAMHYLWNGTWPQNRAPRVKALTLDGRRAKQSVIISVGETYDAAFDVIDHEQDPLRYHWEVKPESDATQEGGDLEPRIPSLDGLLSDKASATTTISVATPGKYRLFAYAYDDQGNVAHANIPFLVRDDNVP